jgi:hypothetical protein
MFPARLEMSFEVLFGRISCSKTVPFLGRLIVKLSSGDAGSIPSRSMCDLWGEEIWGGYFHK